MTDEAAGVTVAREESAAPLTVARSKRNQTEFFLLIAMTCYFVFLFGPGLISLAVAFITIWQGLRTYIVRTVLTPDRIEHRTAWGVWRGVQYSKIMLQEDRGESITIFGEDLLGKSIKFSIFRRDGDFERIAAFLRERISSADRG